VLLNTCQKSARGIQQICQFQPFWKIVRKPLVSGTCASGAFVSRMAASKYSGTEKDPAVDADPQLLNKAREKPQEMNDEEWQELLTSMQYQVCTNVFVVTRTCFHQSSSLIQDPGGHPFMIL